MKRLSVLALFAFFAAVVPAGDLVPIEMGDGLREQKVGGFKARSRARPSGARSRTRTRRERRLRRWHANVAALDVNVAPGLLGTTRPRNLKHPPVECQPLVAEKPTVLNNITDNPHHQLFRHRPLHGQR